MTLQPIGLIFPDVELWATDYLRTALAARDEVYTWGVYVSNRVPAPTKENPHPRPTIVDGSFAVLVIGNH